MLGTSLFGQIKRALAGTFPDRLVRVVHYGSTACGEFADANDVEILVVLRGPVELGKDLDAIVQCLYPIQLDIDLPIHALPVDEKDYLAGEFGLYRSAKREGVVL
jgi:predicted nucleotidyltransferase